MRLKILFWKCVALVWDIRPRKGWTSHSGYPIAWTWINETGIYEYPEGVKVLYELEEKGKRWIVFSR